jgi:hypothetical protein
MEQKFKSLKFDIKTENKSVIRGAIYLEKPSFNYSEILENKNKDEEIKRLKQIRNELSLGLRLNKQDLVLDEKRYKLWTTRGIVSRYKKEIKARKLIPAVVEFMTDETELEIDIDYL